MPTETPEGAVVYTQTELNDMVARGLAKCELTLDEWYDLCDQYDCGPCCAANASGHWGAFRNIDSLLWLQGKSWREVRA